MPFVIAVANQKGGVGKTTTAVTVAAALAERGRRVLLFDLDPQGHVAFSLGLAKAPDFYRLIVDSESLPNVVTRARPGLDVVIGDKRTEAAKRFVTTLDFREGVIRDVLIGAAGYDLAILDLAPSVDVLHVAALVAADFVLIPSRLDALAIDGVNEILRSIAEISRQGHRLTGWAIVPTFFDRVTRETMQQLQDLVKAFPKNVWPPIPQDTRAREAAAYGQTLWEYAPTAPALVGYEQKDKRIGGYITTVDRLENVIDGR
jgi:chromosome partitioning protein